MRTYRNCLRNARPTLTPVVDTPPVFAYAQEGGICGGKRSRRQWCADRRSEMSLTEPGRCWREVMETAPECRRRLVEPSPAAYRGWAGLLGRGSGGHCGWPGGAVRAVISRAEAPR